MEKEKQKTEFNNIGSFEAYIRSFDECPDIVKIDGVFYAMDNYDREGKQITYANKRTLTGFSVFTENRYYKGFSDAKVTEIEEVSIRNDINYYD